MAHSNPVPKLYRSIIEDVIENVREIFAEEGIEEQVLKDLRQLWESKVMQSKATEGFFRDHHTSTQFVLQLPHNLHHTLQTSTASLVFPAGRNIQNFASAELGSSGSRTTFTFPPGISYPIHVPAGVTLQTASGHLYKVNVPVMVTQTAGGPRILHHQQLFQHLGPSSFQTAVPQLKTSETVSQKIQRELSNESQVIQQKELVNGNLVESSSFDPLAPESAGTQQQPTTNVKLSEENGALEEHNPQNVHPALSTSKVLELAMGYEAESGKNGLTNTCQAVQEKLSKEPHNLVQQHVPDNTVQLISPDYLNENLPTAKINTNIHNDIEIIQIDGTGDTSSDEEIGTVRDVEENEFLGIIETEDLKSLEEDGDSASNEDSTSNSSDEEENLLDVIEEDPLNSGDDVSEQEVPDMFDTDNVIVCQYDKIHRSKNKWKFYLKDGVMSFGGKDYVFSKAIGEAEW